MKLKRRLNENASNVLQKNEQLQGSLVSILFPVENS